MFNEFLAIILKYLLPKLADQHCMKGFFFFVHRDGNDLAMQKPSNV